jgi:hypothetical protein
LSVAGSAHMAAAVYRLSDVSRASGHHRGAAVTGALP